MGKMRDRMAPEDDQTRRFAAELAERPWRNAQQATRKADQAMRAMLATFKEARPALVRLAESGALPADEVARTLQLMDEIERDLQEPPRKSEGLAQR